MDFVNRPRRFHHGAAAAVKRFNAGLGEYSDRWFPPDKAESQPVFITPTYSIYKQEVEFGDTGNKGIIETMHYAHFRHYIPFMRQYRSCSSGLKLYSGANGERQFATGSDECLLCKADGVFAPQLTQGVNIIVWGDQHQVVVRDRGQEKKYWQFCIGIGCSFCAQGDKPVPARRAYWPARAADILTLASYEAEALSLRCARGCQTDMVPIGSMCPHCSNVYLDLQETPMNPQQFNAHTSTACTCPQCGKYDYPEPGRGCPTCDGERALELFDIRIQVARENHNPGGKKARYVLSHYGDRILTPEQREFAKQIAIPFDMAEIFAPPTLDEQRVLLNEPDASGQQQQQQFPPQNPGQYLQPGQNTGSYLPAPQQGGAYLPAPQQGGQQFSAGQQPQNNQHYVPYPQQQQQPAQQSGLGGPNVPRTDFFPQHPNFQTGQKQ